MPSLNPCDDPSFLVQQTMRRGVSKAEWIAYSRAMALVHRAPLSALPRLKPLVAKANALLPKLEEREARRVAMRRAA